MAAARVAGPSSMPMLQGQPSTASNDCCGPSRAPDSKPLDQVSVGLYESLGTELTDRTGSRSPYSRRHRWVSDLPVR